jgi:serine/threonine protein kinase
MSGSMSVLVATGRGRSRYTVAAMAMGWTRTLEGRTLAGRYVLERSIGEGGMGAVFAAVQLAVQRRVAVKVLLPGVARDPGIVERFRREAMLAANIARRGAVEIIDFDRDPIAGPFIVMELLDGESLADRLKRHGRLNPREATWIAVSILETLEAVHGRGVIHRDLKPANVFLAREGSGPPVVKVLDFGVARVLAPHGEVTARGAVIGTPRYMAPEQAAGGEVDARADIYAVGAILYACLGGKPYAHVPSEHARAAVLAGPPPPLSQMNRDLPAPLVAVVDRAMARAVAARFTTAAAMRDALVRAAQALPEAPPPSAPPPSTTLDTTMGSIGAPTAGTPSHSGRPLVFSFTHGPSPTTKVVAVAVLGAGALVAGAIALVLARAPASPSPGSATSPTPTGAASGPDVSPALRAEYERARTAWRTRDPRAESLLEKTVFDVEHSDAPRASPAARVAAEALFLIGDLREKAIAPPTHVTPPGPMDFGPVTMSPARKQAQHAMDPFHESATWWIQDVAVCANYRAARIWEKLRAMATEDWRRQTSWVHDASQRTVSGMTASDLRASWLDNDRAFRGLALFEYKGVVALGRAYQGPFKDPTDGTDCLALARERLDALTAEGDGGP